MKPSFFKTRHIAPFILELGSSTLALESVTAFLIRVSKSGRREYIKKEDVPGMIRGGLGICILSTSKGVVANLEARKLGVGGEILCYVW